MHSMRLSVILCCLVLASISYQPSTYALGINKTVMGRAYRYIKAAVMSGCQQVAPMLIADGMVLGVEMCANRIRAGAYGDRSQAMHNRKPVDVPADRGHIAPETVPQTIARIIRLINEPARLHRTGAHMWKAILLTGDPGIGKTEFGFYIARQTGVRVLYESASGLLGTAQGSGAASVRQLFDRTYGQSIWARFKGFIKNLAMRILRRQHQDQKPVVLILDEIDAIGCKREDEVAQEERAREAERVRALEQLLTELDGAHEQTILPKVFVIGTTNRSLDLLDPALIRPGRLRPIHVPPLTEAGREAVLRYHARLANHPLADQVNLTEIARQTEGFSGAALRDLLNAAAQDVAERGNPQIGNDDLLAALHDDPRAGVVTHGERTRVVV